MLSKVTLRLGVPIECDGVMLCHSHEQSGFGADAELLEQLQRYWITACISMAVLTTRASSVFKKTATRNRDHAFSAVTVFCAVQANTAHVIFSATVGRRAAGTNCKLNKNKQLAS